jgi:hypothetical protein
MSFLEILNLFKTGKASAKSHIKNLIEVAAIDGDFSQVEYDLLKSIARRNGVSEAQLDEIRKNPEAIKLELPTESKERFRQFYDLIHMMSIDKLIHPEEMKLCDFFAIRFGYQRNNIATLIESILSCIANNLEADETMNRVIRLI